MRRPPYLRIGLWVSAKQNIQIASASLTLGFGSEKLKMEPLREPHFFVTTSAARKKWFERYPGIVETRLAKKVSEKVDRSRLTFR